MQNPKIKKAFIGSGIRYDLLTKSYNKKGDEKDMYEYLIDNGIKLIK